MAGKRATSSDVARLAGVSQPTVSMILNHYENSRFSEETVQKVMDACEQLNYKIPSARRQSGGEKGNSLLVAISPTLENLHYVRILKAAEGQAEAKGYTLVSMITNRDKIKEKQIVDMVLSFKAAGALYLYKPVNTVALTRLMNQIPVILICDKAEVNNVSSVNMDSEKTGVLIGEHLLELGHKKIAYVAPDLSDRFVHRQLRLAGLKKAFRDAHVSPFNIRVCTMDSEGISGSPGLTSYEAGFCLGGVVADQYPEVTALVGMNDMTAMGIMDALLQRKYRIPRDYSVCGCDNTIISRFNTVSLTSVEPFSIDRGQEAVNVLIRKIEDHDAADTFSTVQVEFAPKLIVRGSTGPNHKNP